MKTLTPSEKAYLGRIADPIVRESERLRLEGLPVHFHDWLLKDGDRLYRDGNGAEFVIDTYVCECGAGGFIKTPKKLYDDGVKMIGITEGQL